MDGKILRSVAQCSYYPYKMAKVVASTWVLWKQIIQWQKSFWMDPFDNLNTELDLKVQQPFLEELY